MKTPFSEFEVMSFEKDLMDIGVNKNEKTTSSIF